jgi:hypothetical protein
MFGIENKRVYAWRLCAAASSLPQPTGSDSSGCLCDARVATGRRQQALHFGPSIQVISFVTEQLAVTV